MADSNFQHSEFDEAAEKAKKNLEELSIISKFYQEIYSVVIKKKIAFYKLGAYISLYLIIIVILGGGILFGYADKITSRINHSDIENFQDSISKIVASNQNIPDDKFKNTVDSLIKNLYILQNNTNNKISIYQDLIKQQNHYMDSISEVIFLNQRLEQDKIESFLLDFNQKLQRQNDTLKAIKSFLK